MINPKFEQYLEIFDNEKISSPLLFYLNYLTVFISHDDLTRILTYFNCVTIELKDLLEKIQYMDSHNLDFAYIHTFNKDFVEYYNTPYIKTSFLYNSKMVIKHTYRKIILILLEDLTECIKMLIDRITLIEEKMH